MYIWIGPLHDIQDIKNIKGASYAATIWQLNFISELVKKENVICIAYKPESYFPKGRFLPVADISTDFITVRTIKYLNLPFLRQISLYYSFRFYLRKYKLDNNLKLITYNSCIESHYKIGCYLIDNHKINWFNIVAESSYTTKASKTLFLSYNSFLNAKLKNKYFFHGGVFDKSNKKCNYLHFENNTIKLLFSGNISNLSGVYDLIEMFKKIEHKFIYEIELHIFGSSNDNRINKLIHQCKNIFYHGFVSDNILDNSIINSTILVNPMPSDDKFNSNFPSKLLKYLSFNKPVLSTNTRGLNSEFDNVLFYYKSDSQFINQINNIINLDDKQVSLKIKNLNKFRSQNQWSKFVDKFISL